MDRITRSSLDGKLDMSVLVLAVRRVKRRHVAFFANLADVASPLSNDVTHVVRVNRNRCAEKLGHVVSVLCCVGLFHYVLVEGLD